MAAPAGLKRRGAALWRSLGQKTGTPLGALALEAARAVDRLDELDRIIQGKGVSELMQFRVLDDHLDDEGTQRVHVEVKFNGVLAEARQQQNGLRQLITSLMDAQESASKDAPRPAASQANRAVDEFTKKRRSRGA